MRWVVLPLLAGCQIVFPLEEPPLRTCTEASECVEGLVEGTCDCGLCAFPDPACAISGRRWDAAGALTKQCVPVADQVDARVFHTCVRMSDGTAWCWGLNLDGQLGQAQPIGVDAIVPVPLFANGEPTRDIVEIRTSVGATCALRTDATVSCWGSNAEGELGAGLPLGQRSEDPQLVTDGTNVLGNVTALTMGYGHACARIGTAELYCWGNGKKGQLGDPALLSSPVARKVPLQAGTIGAISAGGDHTCANVDAPQGKRTYCWGRTAEGRLGANDPFGADDVSPTPRAVLSEDLTELPDAHAVAAGNHHTCIIKTPAEVHCWGRNAHGEVGDDSLTERHVAILIPTKNREAQRVVAADAHTCAITEEVLQCWGIDSDGEIGDGDGDGGADELTPRVVTMPVRQIDLTAGHAHSCSIGVDRTLSCWGLSDHGELGLGDTLPRTSPTPISAVAFCPSRE